MLYNFPDLSIALQQNLASNVRPVILVVDDDCELSGSVRDLLTSSGFDATCVGNGDEAMAYLQRHPRPAAILLDLFMPVMNGWTFTRRLRGTRFESIPIIVVTGSGPHWGYPSERVVRKPIDADNLLDVVRQITSAPNTRPD